MKSRMTRRSSGDWYDRKGLSIENQRICIDVEMEIDEAAVVRETKFESVAAFIRHVVVSGIGTVSDVKYM